MDIQGEDFLANFGNDERSIGQSFGLQSDLRERKKFLSPHAIQLSSLQPPIPEFEGKLCLFCFDNSCAVVYLCS